MELPSIAQSLSADLQRIRFGLPITHVYNPLDYAWEPHAAYLRRYGAGRREVLLVGMNPGPWGMLQTGVPFGEVHAVRDWLDINGAVGKPKRLHPKRPVSGFACERSEVSGARLWGWARDTFHCPSRFFSRFFVANYCPLAFFDQAGRNITPDRLAADLRAKVQTVCDRALRQSVEYLEPALVVGIGKFAERRVIATLDGLGVRVGGILHPSPASPAANRDWARKVTAQLELLGVTLPPRSRHGRSSAPRRRATTA